MTVRMMFRLAALDCWRPPAGVERHLVIRDDGKFEVHLHIGRQCSRLVVPAGVGAADIVHHIYSTLDRYAATLLTAHGTWHHNPESSAEERFELQLGCGETTFEEGLRKAMRKARP